MSLYEVATFPVDWVVPRFNGTGIVQLFIFTVQIALRSLS